MPGTAYGAVVGPKQMLPVISALGRSAIVANYEQIVVGSGLTGTGGFNVGGLVLNPGIDGNWGWIGKLSQNYQKFRFRMLRFIYVPQTPTSTPGSVFLYMQYDSPDSPPADLAGVSASESSVIGNSWYGGPINSEIAFSKKLTIRDNVFIDVDVSRFSQPWYYIRSTSGHTLNVAALSGTPTGGIGSLALTGGTTYEYTTRPGVIYFGTNNVTNAVVAGNLYMSYVLELSEPILGSLNY